MTIEVKRNYHPHFTETDMKVGVLQFFGWRDGRAYLANFGDTVLAGSPREFASRRARKPRSGASWSSSRA